MVIEDLNQLKKKAEAVYQADPTERMISFLLDSALLAPLITFVCSIHLKEIELDQAQGFTSSLIYSMWMTALFTSISLQSLFLYFFSSTPGQAFLNLKVQSIETEKLEWGACFLRSLTFHFSFFLMMIPFIEALTHRLGRCAHDRVSDTIVVQAHASQKLALSNQARWNLKFVVFVIVYLSFSIFLFHSDESLSYPQLQSTVESESLDQVVAEALLLKKFDSETQKKVDGLLWKARAEQHSPSAYYYRFKSATKKSDQLFISQVMCQKKQDVLCQAARGELGLEHESLKFDKNLSRTAMVALMQQSAQRFDLKTAYLFHLELQEIEALSMALKVWDVSLFLRSMENPSQRQPASVTSESLPDETQLWLQNYRNERNQL